MQTLAVWLTEPQIRKLNQLPEDALVIGHTGGCPVIRYPADNELYRLSDRGSLVKISKLRYAKARYGHYQKG